MKIKVKRIIHYKENFHGKLNDIYLMLPDYIYELIRILMVKAGKKSTKNPKEAIPCHGTVQVSNSLEAIHTCRVFFYIGLPLFT